MDISFKQRRTLIFDYQPLTYFKAAQEPQKLHFSPLFFRFIFWGGLLAG